MVPWAHVSQRPKRYLHRFSRFWMALPCDQRTDSQTDTPRYVCHLSATEHDINNQKETRQSTGTPLHVPKYGELWSTNG